MSKKNKSGNRFTQVLLLIFLFALKTAFTQDTTYKILKPVFVQASFLYDFPESYGFTAGINSPLKSIEKNYISKNGKLHAKQKDLFWGVDASVYRYPYNYTGILLVPFIGVRHRKPKSFFWETTFGLGLLRTFYDGKVYELDDAGNVKEKPAFGRFYATAQLSTAFNVLLQKSPNPILALQIKPMIWLQYPYNSFIKPHISLEAGIKYEISNLTTTTSKTTKYREKRT